MVAIGRARYFRKSGFRQRLGVSILRATSRQRHVPNPGFINLRPDANALNWLGIAGIISMAERLPINPIW